MQHKKLQGEIESKKIGINHTGGGGKRKIEIKEEVCLCLLYLRKILTLEVLGLHFGIWKTEAKETFDYWLEILRNVLLASILKQLEKHDRDSAMAIELLTEFHLIVHTMEQPPARPSDNQEQKKYFSGKKKEGAHILSAYQKEKILSM
jgi:hypothetical protein